METCWIDVKPTYESLIVQAVYVFFLEVIASIYFVCTDSLPQFLQLAWVRRASPLDLSPI